MEPGALMNLNGGFFHPLVLCYKKNFLVNQYKKINMYKYLVSISYKIRDIMHNASWFQEEEKKNENTGLYYRDLFAFQAKQL